MRTVIGSLMIVALAACSGKQAGIEGIPFRGAGSESWGMAGRNGTELCPDLFQGELSPLVNGRFAAADTAGMWQLFAFDGEARPVSEKKYAAIGHFFEDVTIAQREEGLPLELIDKQGQWVATLDDYLGTPLLAAHNFREGRALVYAANHKYGYVNPDGTMAIAPEYDYACDFSEGLALTGKADEEGRLAYQTIDREGNLCFPVALRDCRLNEFFSDGYLLFRNLREGRSGALNRKGEVAVYFPEEVLDVLPYRAGVALFWTEKGVGLMDKEGDILIPAIYEEGKPVGEKQVALKMDGKWAVFSSTGKPLCDFKYDWIAGDNGCTAGRRDSVYVLLDETGKEIAGSEFAEIGWDLYAEGVLPQAFAVRKAAEEPLEKESTPKPKKEKPKPLPRLKQARIDENNPFYQEAQRIWQGGLEEKDAENRRVILNYMEHFRMSYVTKDIDFLEQLFSEQALIIVGNVVRQAPEDGHHYLSEEKVSYSIRTKREYLERLREIFEKNKTVNVEFTDFTVKRHPTREGIYGVSVKQRYTSDLYSDEGYVFLLWDFRDETAPKIHVRTWQPRMLDEHTPLPEQEIFNIGSFNLE